ncbi:MAG: hypothetical protein SOU05_04160 [Atopobium sp.]|uniref:hypothetical protein n=1 Tax=Atopobium sp. TaxID=1872650 RepID=UPI002A75DCF3|nr:hypothetical protein [Atopobium sp.]MDY2788582.1 hypothetical protein [Atopobium sp.]
MTTRDIRRQRIFLRTLESEFLKAGFYPPITVTALAIVLFSAVASAYLTYMAWARPDAAAGLTPFSAYQFALPAEQVGFALLGALVLYMDETVMVRTLLAVPNRGRLLATKVAVSAALSAGISALSVSAAYGASIAVLAVLGCGASADVGGFVRVGSLVAWWAALSVLVTLLSVLVRKSMPVLVVSLAMMLALSPVLRSLTAAAAWLPDQLALCLYQVSPSEGSIGMPTAAVGLALWLVAAYAGARASLARLSV